MIEAYPNGEDEKGKQMIGIFVNKVLVDRLTMEQIAEMWKKLSSDAMAKNMAKLVDEQEAKDANVLG